MFLITLIYKIYKAEVVIFVEFLIRMPFWSVLLRFPPAFSFLYFLNDRGAMMHHTGLLMQNAPLKLIRCIAQWSEGVTKSPWSSEQIEVNLSFLEAFGSGCILYAEKRFS